MNNSRNIDGFPPNINPQEFAWIAAIIGSACVGDYTAAEQNSIGNWLVLVGQFILTTSAQQSLIETRLENGNININSQEHKNGGSYFANNGRSNQNQRPEVDFLLDAIANIQEELNNLKNKQN